MSHNLYEFSYSLNSSIFKPRTIVVRKSYISAMNATNIVVSYSARFLYVSMWILPFASHVPFSLIATSANVLMKDPRSHDIIISIKINSCMVQSVIDCFVVQSASVNEPLKNIDRYVYFKLSTRATKTKGSVLPRQENPKLSKTVPQKILNAQHQI